MQVGNISREKESLKQIGEALQNYKDTHSSLDKHINYQAMGILTQDIRLQQQAFLALLNASPLHARSDRSKLLQLFWRKRLLGESMVKERASTARD